MKHAPAEVPGSESTHDQLGSTETGKQSTETGKNLAEHTSPPIGMSFEQLRMTLCQEGAEKTLIRAANSPPTILSVVHELHNVHR